ncbi:MAG: HAD family hydrolase [Clostridia bacterium]|nr:HAD family hydrolase [Clostridia bacterium]
MAITTVMFDLDGTLLPMNQDYFIETYFETVVNFVSTERRYDKKELYFAMWAGIKEIMNNNFGARPNDQVFWEQMANRLGERILSDKDCFEKYYATKYQELQRICGFNQHASRTVKMVRQAGANCVLATNPFFPQTAIDARLSWAGVELDDFIHVTTYDKSSFCKPDPDYYREILSVIGAKPEECIMVGNDASDDLAAEQAGIKTFILTDCLINTGKVDLTCVPCGSFIQLQQFLAEQLK